jgi:2-keto-4-pentenoate hydratase/2-oxohepta-3-ene-1,7-dioic acid hydratase in catechol pathway
VPGNAPRYPERLEPTVDRRVRFESWLLQDATFATTLQVGDDAWDLGTLLSGMPGLACDERRETPLDALVQSGLFMTLLPELAQSRARPGMRTMPRARPVSPVIRPQKILAFGRTYREHAVELGNAPRTEPLVFDKLPDSLIGTSSEVQAPDHADGRLDHEAELALVVGARAFRLRNGNGSGVLAGVTIANDLTLRGVQKAAQKAGHPWLLAKSFPGACALGPFLTPLGPDLDPDRLRISCRVNGGLRQEASTSDLLMPVGALVEWISQRLPLNPGDVILTGTPAGTGPLQRGDVCEVTISGDSIDLGTLVTRIA